VSAYYLGGSAGALYERRGLPMEPWEHVEVLRARFELAALAARRRWGVGALEPALALLDLHELRVRPGADPLLTPDTVLLDFEEVLTGRVDAVWAERLVSEAWEAS
jgi:hypothetical protein